MFSVNHLEFSVVVCVQLVLICVHLYSLPVMCQDNYDGEIGARQRRSTQGSTRQCINDSAILTCSKQPTVCEDDEVSHGGSCYRFIRDDLKSRDEAHSDCIARSSHLVYIESEEEQTFLANHSESLIGDISRNNAMNHYWIGLIPTSSNVWLDGNQANNSLFEFFQNSAAGCFSIHRSNDERLLLRSRNCDSDRFYICERLSECSQGEYFNHNGSCYWIGDSTMSHISAQGSCKGGHLLYIESEKELQFINNNVTSVDDTEIWIGLTTQYAWLDGSRAVYQGFVRSDNSNNGGSRCFRLRPQDDFLWNDANCRRNFSYICEREIPVNVYQNRNVSQGVSCRPPGAGLNRPIDSVPLCVRSDSHYFNNSVLCRCDDDETCINGCGCARDNTVAGLKTIRCSCGFCNFTFDASEDDNSNRVWPSNFSCSCCVNGTSSRATVVNGEFTCVPDDSESLTTPGDDRNEQPATPSVTSEGVGQQSTEGGATGKPVTTDKPMTTGETAGVGDPADQTGVSIGIFVGVTLSLLFLLVVLVVGVIWWKRREKSKGIDKPLTTNTHVIGSDTTNVNPTYGLDEDDHVTEDNLKHVAAVGPSVFKSNPLNVYADEKPNEQSVIAAETSEEESYATIESVGYIPYKPKGREDDYTAIQGNKDSNRDNNAACKPKRGNDVYIDLNKTGNDDDDGDDDDDPAVYTPFPNNDQKQNKDDPEDEYVHPGNWMVEPSEQRSGINAQVPLPKPKNLTKDSGYVDVDALVGDSRGSGYVSVDSPSAIVLNHQDDDPVNEYYFKLEKPTADDEGEYSLAGAPGGNDYDTFNRAGGKSPGTNGPTNDGLYNIAAVPEDNEYNTFDRPGDRRPRNNAPTDEGLYNLTSSPESNAYNTFNRPGGKHPSANAPTDDGLYSVTSPPGDDEYSTFDRPNGRRPSNNAPTDEGVYSLTGPPEGDVYSTTNRVGQKPMPRVPATTNESEYSTLD